MTSHPVIPVGLCGSASVIVTRELTVAHWVPGMPEVYGTPFMIYLMEVAAGRALEPHLPAGWISVGHAVNVRHLAATPLGAEVTASATVVAVEDRLVTFSVQARDGIELIGEGTHVRGLVELERFLARIERKAVAPPR